MKKWLLIVCIIVIVNVAVSASLSNSSLFSKTYTAQSNEESEINRVDVQKTDSWFQNVKIALADHVYIVKNYVANVFASEYVREENNNATSTTKNLQEKDDQKKVTHIPTPEPLKAIYMTSWVAGTPSLRENIFNIIDETEINAIVIDIKDDTGRISFLVNDPFLQEIDSSENRIADLDEIISTLHERGVYVIGRIAVFQDPYLAKKRHDLAVKRASDGEVWQDRKGLSWLDAGSREVWDYAVAIAHEAYNRGFDEINVDYVRFPSDGNVLDIAYPFSEGKVKAEVIRSFLLICDHALTIPTWFYQPIYLV